MLFAVPPEEMHIEPPDIVVLFATPPDEMNIMSVEFIAIPVTTLPEDISIKLIRPPVPIKLLLQILIYISFLRRK